MRFRLTLMSVALAGNLFAQKPFVPNYDEDKVGTLPMPDLLVCEDGTPVTDREVWLQKRRPQLFSLFEREMFGKTAYKSREYTVQSQVEEKDVFGGAGKMYQVTLVYGSAKDQKANLIYFLPANTNKPAPCFVILNFGGNHEILADKDIHLSEGWFRENKKSGYIDNKATEESRGSGVRRWPIEDILKRGYGVATVYYGDFDPDFDDGFQNGVHPLGYANGAQKPSADEWGSIGAWSWGLSLIASYLETIPEVDKSKLAVAGHSRLGKAALWAGAQDERFGIVISNNSGAGGAALSKRLYGETVGRLNTAFPHWFCGNFKKYSENEAALPFDQHQLLALMAPRPVYVASATNDQWADPKGEFLAAKLAEPVYGLFGKPAAALNEMPAPDIKVGNQIGYHLRTGDHDILKYDWDCYMDFADSHWGKPE